MEPAAPRLKSALWVQATVRRAAVNGDIVTVLRSGDPDSGSILVKLSRYRTGASVLAETRDARGARAWYRVTGPDFVADEVAEAALARAGGRDPDAWLVEVEDRGGALPFDEPIITG